MKHISTPHPITTSHHRHWPIANRRKMQKSSSSSNSNSDLVVPICALKPLDSVIWQAFVKYQDDPVKQMKRLTTEQVQSILLLIAIFELRSCGKSLSGSEQGTLILDQYQKMLAMVIFVTFAEPVLFWHSSAKKCSRSLLNRILWKLRDVFAKYFFM